MSEIIKKITLDIDGIEIGLTPEQAKKLHMALDELIGEKRTVEHVHHHDNWYWQQPYRWTYGTVGIGQPSTTTMYNATTANAVVTL